MREFASKQSQPAQRAHVNLTRSRSAGRGPAEAVPPIVHEALETPGQQLDTATRTLMERRFGHDFSRVRVHNDQVAARSAEAVAAEAYTVGSDVVSGRDVMRLPPATGSAFSRTNWSTCATSTGPGRCCNVSLSEGSRIRRSRPNCARRLTSGG